MPRNKNKRSRKRAERKRKARNIELAGKNLQRRRASRIAREQELGMQCHKVYRHEKPLDGLAFGEPFDLFT